MCRVDYCDEHCTVLADAWRRARKPHKCTECGRVIDPGERYHFEAVLFDGAVGPHKTCEHCSVARNWLGWECGGFVYGEVAEEIREHAEEYWPNHATKLLLRLDAGLKARWRRTDGSLWRVPTQ